MPVRYFLILDNGGTNTKALVFDVYGNELAASSFPTHWIQRRPGMREIDLEGLKDSLYSAIREVIAGSGIQRGEIAGVACVGHGKGLYLLDAGGNIFRHGILSTDARASELAASFERDVEEIYPISAQHVMPSQAPVLLSWLKEHEPDTYARIGSVLSAKDFVRFLLSGDIHQELGDASGNNLINLRTATYDKRLTSFFGVPEASEWLPELVRSDSIVSMVSRKTAAETGLAEGTPIVGGLFDIDAGALGSGVLDDRHYAAIAGTWNINVYPADAPTANMSGIMNSLFPGGKVLVEASSPTSAGNLSKMLQLLIPEKMARDDGSIYRELDDRLSSGGATSTPVLYMPFLYGSNTDPFASASFIGMNSTTTTLQLIRAVYEGITFAHKQHIDQLLRTADSPPSSIRVCGGAAHSRMWMQLFADVIGISIETLQSQEMTGLGGAMLCACATGVYATLEEAACGMVRVNERFEPDLRQNKLYLQKYSSYQTLLTQLNGHWPQSSRWNKE